jgi:hypothetical protein
MKELQLPLVMSAPEPESQAHQNQKPQNSNDEQLIIVKTGFPFRFYFTDAVRLGEKEQAT